MLSVKSSSGGSISYSGTSRTLSTCIGATLKPYKGNNNSQKCHIEILFCWIITKTGVRSRLYETLIIQTNFVANLETFQSVQDTVIDPT